MDSIKKRISFLIVNIHDLKIRNKSCIEKIYDSFLKYNIYRTMNLTEKLSNPFLKPSPFRSVTNSNNTSYNNYGNLN